MDIGFGAPGEHGIGAPAFKPFGSAMTQIQHRKVDKSYEIYLALYQAITGPEESQKIYKKFSRDFFDLIIVDECHRGSAEEDSAWREILEYFANAAQIGMTATPKATKYASNIDYFGDPLFSYSLKQGIEDVPRPLQSCSHRPR